ncbi:MAG: aminoacyl-tRNA hydrolase [Bacilli bacterium]|nr:aminoacyl-tRNA hydrolase [Bacilli bacterium]
MKLIVGLGNPGSEYAGTRHNMGFMAIDKFADMANGSFDRSMFKGVYGMIKNSSLGEDVIIAKPETYMNFSGEFVQQFMAYFKISPDDLIVVFDDMALKEGQIRLREGGSSGGQKGMQNIIDLLGTDKIKRIRIGIGEPAHGAIDWVLGKPSGESLEKIEEGTTNAARAIRDAIKMGFNKTMSLYNGGGRHG